MQDRVSQYPGRVKLTPVSGQENVYDMEWADGATVVGDPLNKNTFLTDATAALYGLGPDAVPDAAFQAVVAMQNALKASGGWVLAYSKTTAGAFTWKAPDLFGGKAYKAGVLIIGGGGSGACSAIQRDPSQITFIDVTGGASGYTATIIFEVTPGASYSGVVGAGGAAVTKKTSQAARLKGNSGGTSSFKVSSSLTLTALGGQGGNHGGDRNGVDGALGGQNSSCSHAVPGSSETPFGGTLVPTSYVTDVVGNYFIQGGQITSCFNPFTLQKILGAGGWANKKTTGPGGKNPLTGKGGGNAGLNTNGQSANEPGCGGGGAWKISTEDISVSSGAGAPGAVYLYVMGGEQ